MLELGVESEKEHAEILKIAQNLNFSQIITVGEQFQNVCKKELNFLDTSELIDYLKDNKITSENILLKASRGIALEKLIDHL